SSRRRHTRCLSDWSSDVCSSDLIAAKFAADEIDDFSYGNSRHRRNCRVAWAARLTKRWVKSLNRFDVPASYKAMKRTLLSLMIAGSMALTGAAFAGSPSSYQVTGPVTAVDD